MSKRPSETDRHPSVTESGDDDTFLSRWARRKRVARSGADPDAPRADAPVEEETRVASVPDVGEGSTAVDASQPPEPGDEDMPSVDSIDENTDMSGFFSPRVSQAVKKAALRKFFHSPAFNVVDGLDDYADDFTSFAALGDIITSDMRGKMELEAERAKERLAEAGRAGEQAPATAQTEENAARPVDAQGVPDSIDDDDLAGEAPERAPLEPGVTRDPSRQAKAGPGKLRPRSDEDDDA